MGAKPPGALKFTVPNDAIVFEVDLTLDENRTKRASIQALVLKEKPKSQSYVPGRYVFGGKKRPVSAGAKLKEEQQRALRRRNVSEANRTKIGLNAERNVLASWERSPLEAIGGPWPDQAPDQREPDSPYHYTVAEVKLNATPGDLEQLELLEERLASLVDDRDEKELRQQADKIIRPLANRAWRRPIADDELDVLLQLYDESRGGGGSFDSSVKSSLLAVLASPHFLYRSFDTVSSGSDGLAELSSQALATRLAFFLWGSLPDEELLRLAAADKLRDPAMLRTQARRMLRDPRAKSLAIDFAGQLWGFNDFGSFDNPDSQRFKQFTPQLRAAMLTEVVLFLSDLIRHDQPLTHVLSADYTFANRELARYYKLPQADLPTDGWVRIAAPPNRGGLATMGLFLTKTSLPLRTSPVQRGVWVMESLLGRHLPNPPADVPPLSEDETNDAGQSIREQLEKHRAQASCASSHDKIDPPGIKLRGDALGRAVHVGDRALLQRMHKHLREEDLRFSVLVEEIVTSRQFRMKRVEH